MTPGWPKITPEIPLKNCLEMDTIYPPFCDRLPFVVNCLWCYHESLYQYYLRWPQITPKIPSKNCLEMDIIPTKFQVHKKNFTLVWPQMTLEIQAKCNFEIEITQCIPTKFQVHTKVYTNDLGWPLDYLEKIKLEIIVIIPTKFHYHTTVKGLFPDFSIIILNVF